MTPQQLNTDFGIAGVLEFISGAGDFPMIKIETPLATALVSLHGAQVLSFQPKSAENDLLFLSEKANYQVGKAIRGGIPICWPWFSREKPRPQLPNHGFARTSLWQVTETSRTGDVIQLQLSLQDNAQTREMWPHAFKLSLDIKISDQLELSLTAKNTGSELFQFSQAMHTYFAVSDIEQIAVSGLEGVNYIDTVGGDNKVHQQSGAIQVSNETDRIYTDFSDDVQLQDIGFNRAVDIQSSGSKTTVVWNPWEVISTEMKDLNDDAYRAFICIETVNTGEDLITLEPMENHTISALYTVSTS